MMISKERIEKVDGAYSDFVQFKSEGKNEYAAIAVRTITEVIVASYVEYFVPDILYQENQLTIMEQIKALEQCQSFRQDQIPLLHSMRKIGNAGAHQGEKDSFEISDFHLNNATPKIENVICTWKDWLDTDYSEWYAKQEYEQKELELKRKKIALQEEIKYSVISLISIGVIIFLTVDIQINFIKIGLEFYENVSLKMLYIGYALLLFVTFCCRKKGMLPRLICDLGMVYFLIPRLYLAILSKDHLSDRLFFIFVSFMIVVLYTVVCIKSIETSRGYEVKGYK